MNCAWDALLSILPPVLRREVDRQGKDSLQELRLRLNQPPELVLREKSVWLGGSISRDDLSFVVNTASKYSPWAAATAAKGYITAPGGHRIGMCGACVIRENEMTGIRELTSLCLRVARDFPGIARGVTRHGSVLILGPPGSGKTTLLRDLIRQRSDGGEGSIAVVDERGELFPQMGCFLWGKRTDVLTGCTKAQGIGAALRTMGPSTIAVDEITDPEDCAALMQAGWCGVSMLATAHAFDAEDLRRRPVYEPLAKSRLFDTLLILDRDKSWRMERMKL